jgi:hypothetical protein
MKTMRQRVRPGWWGCLVSLAALAALLLPGASRAQPPPEPGKLPGPAEGAPFQLTTRENVAVLAVGASSAPATGLWSLQITLRAGSLLFDDWDYGHGPLTRLHSRRLLGAQTLFLGGFTPAPGLPTALLQAGVLQVGEDLTCWNLIDTDQCRPFPRDLLEPGVILDGKGFFSGKPETEAYNRVVIQSHYTSPRAFRRAARLDLTYPQIFADPATYRGQVVHMAGPLRMLSREKPPQECRAAGVSDLYEAWILNEDTREFFCFLSTELPRSLDPYLGEEGKKKFKDKIVRVSADGYFFKKFRYKAADSKSNTARDTPVFFGHSLVYTPGPDDTTESDEWGHGLMAVFIGIVGFAVMVVVGMTWWFRHADRRVRGRVLAARDTGFVLPPPDAVVPAVPTPEPSEETENSPDPQFGGRLGDFSGPAR